MFVVYILNLKEKERENSELHPLFHGAKTEMGQTITKNPDEGKVA